MADKTIIFDMDGTIKNISLLELIAVFKVIITRAKKNPEDFFSDIKEFIQWFKNDWWKDIIAMGYSQNGFSKLLDKHYNHRMKFFPWVKKIIPELSQTNRLTIFTSNKASIATASLKKADLLSFFKLIIGNEHLKKDKPDPEGINLIHAVIKDNMSNYIMIGDTEKDILAGKRAEIKTGLVSWGATAKGLEDWNNLLKLKPDYVFEEPDDLIKMLC